MIQTEDLRRLPVEVRKAGLAGLLRKPSQGIALSTHYTTPAKSSISRPASSAVRHRVEAARLALPLRPLQTVGEG